MTGQPPSHPISTGDRLSTGPGLRFAAAIGSLVFVCAALIALGSRTLLSGMLMDRARAQATATATTFAEVHADAILTAETASLAKAVRTILETEPWLLYISVFGAHGDLLSTATHDGSTIAHAAPTSSPILTALYVTEVIDSGARIYDFGVPVVPGLPARVHLGVRQRELEGPLRDIDLLLGAMALLVALIGAVAAWHLGRRLGRPTDRLVEAARAIGSGRPDCDIPTQTGDPHLDRIAAALAQLRADLAEQRLQTGREALRAAAAEKLAALGTLVAGIAHQVNNPLAGILSSIDMARRSTTDPNERELFLDLAQEAADRLRTLMRRLTEYARTGRTDLRMIDLNAVVRHAVTFGQSWDRRDDPPPELRLSEQPLWVMAEFDALSDVVLNLYSNARLSAPGQALCLSTHDTTDVVILRVTDHGPGVAPAIKQRIFEPFFTTRDAQLGTGLGLALSESIIRRHGGAIWVEDNPEGGAIFCVRLPRTHGNSDRTVA